MGKGSPDTNALADAGSAYAAFPDGREEVALSVLTKIFVVLVTFLSIILVALVVPFVANTENYKKVALDLESLRDQAEASAELLENELGAMQAGREAQLLKAQQTEKDHKDQLSMLRGAKTAAEDEVQELVVAARQAALSKSHADATAAQLAQVVASLRDELNIFRAKLADSVKRGLEVAIRNSDLDSQLASLERQVRRLSEDYQIASETLVKTKALLDRVPPATIIAILGEQAAADGDVVVGYMPATPIHGRITLVTTYDNGDTDVQLDVGTIDGVAKNMKFFIHRGGDYMGTVLITVVDINASAGRVMFNDGQIVADDQVMTGAEDL